MLAIDGPTDIIRAPTGTLRPIQRPASRPPGTPPEPARKVDAFDGCTLLQLDTASETVSTARASGMIHARRRNRQRDRHGIMLGSHSLKKRAASTATAGAMGRRYWKPLIGNSW